ncbi:MAG: hypothetical protein HY898_09340 [Deltaproteobacteria bacterium]|nr:hypothetical protein [Deltaproteobacteria bacterium]
MRKTIAFVVFLCVCLLAASALAKPRYPIKAADYRKTITTRVESIWARMEKKLDFHNVSPDRKKTIRHAFDDAVKEVWVEVDKASLDGNITRDEALKVSAVTSGIRGKVRGKLASEKKAQAAADKPAPKTTAEKTAATRVATDKPAPKKTDEAAVKSKDKGKTSPASKKGQDVHKPISGDEAKAAHHRSDAKAKGAEPSSDELE